MTRDFSYSNLRVTPDLLVDVARRVPETREVHVKPEQLDRAVLRVNAMWCGDAQEARPAPESEGQKPSPRRTGTPSRRDRGDVPASHLSLLDWYSAAKGITRKPVLVPVLKRMSNGLDGNRRIVGHEDGPSLFGGSFHARRA